MFGRVASAALPFFVLWHTICLCSVGINTLQMTDIDFIRLAAFAFAMQLIGKSQDPVNDGIEMAERLFNKLKEKEV